MIRVLHIMGCADAGGISSVVLNYYRFLDRVRFHFDIALTVSEAGQNANALAELGAQIVFLPLKSQGLLAFQRALEKLLQDGEYDAVHVHESETCYVALRVAKKLGIPCRIAHAHTTSPWEGVKGEFRRLSGCLLNYYYATHIIGCGQLAGERVFGKRNMSRTKALVLPNAVDTERFAFSAAVRQQVRKELGLEGKYVVGMVGRLTDEKNYPFAISLMAQLCAQNPRAILVVAGNGPNEAMICDLIAREQLEDRVIMLGRRKDVERLYQAFDLFLMPSLSEGYPVAAVEAMASGLPVLLSDTITAELKFCSGVTYLSLNRPKEWLERILFWQEDGNRVCRQREPRDNGLDIRDTARLLERVYEEDCSEWKTLCQR